MGLRLLAWVLGLSLLASSVQAATEVISLNYRSADELLPIAQSVVGGQGRLAAQGNQLVVTAPSEVIQELRQTLQELDRVPRRLLISVDTQDFSNNRGQGYQVDGSINTGEVSVQSGHSERNQVRIIRRNTSSRDGGIQQVQATEGYPALLEVGQRVPLTNTNTDRYGDPYQNTEYHNVMRGFYATTTINGDWVQINLSTQRDRVNHNRPEVLDLQSTETRVSGRLGEWIPVSGIDENASSQRDGILRHYSTQGSQNQSLRIRVELLD